MREPKAAIFDPVEGTPPDFFHELYDEVLGFFVVLRDFTLHPVAFSREWSEGRRRAMNPVGFFGIAVGVQLAAAAVLAHFRPGALPGEGEELLRQSAPELYWLIDLLASQLPLVKAAIFAAIVHRRMVKKGSTQNFRGSLGAVLYAEGWEQLGRALAAAAALAFGKIGGETVSSIVGIVALAMLALALGGVHRLKKKRAAIGPMALGGVGVALVAATASSLAWGPLLKKNLAEGKLHSTVSGTGWKLEIKPDRDGGQP